MNDLLFDVSWWIPALLAVIAISLVVNGDKRQVSRVRNAGVGLLLVAVGWALLSYFVDTDKEKVNKQTHRLIKDVVDGDWADFRSHLTVSATFATKAGTVVTGGDLVSTYAQTSAERIHVTSATVRDLTDEEHDGVIATRFSLVSTQDALTPIETSTWEFDWEKTTAGWKASSLRLISIRDVPSDDLFRELMKGKH
ncbi:MAG TPA: hypothetical protein VG326_09550 [Tepidisphaeraceae bacterium]|jgi:hypothetical protein|nr:hypothetical protein [Tepidisphaeraceae bacterium]